MEVWKKEPQILAKRAGGTPPGWDWTQPSFVTLRKGRTASGAMWRENAPGASSPARRWNPSTVATTFLGSRGHADVGFCGEGQPVNVRPSRTSTLSTGRAAFMTRSFLLCRVRGGGGER